MAKKGPPSEEVKIAAHVKDIDGPLMVVDLQQEMVSARAGGDRYRVKAQRNERWVVGDQTMEVSDDGLELVDVVGVEGAPLTKRNYSRNIHATWVSRFMEDFPSIEPWPNAPGVDEGKVEIARQLLEYHYEVEQLDDKLFDLVGMALLHSGTAGIWTTWDPLAGPRSPGYQDVDPKTGAPQFERDPDGTVILDPDTMQPIPLMVGVGAPTGDVRFDIVSIFDFWTSPTVEHIEQAQWCARERLMDRYEAMEIARLAGHHNDVWSEFRDTSVETIWGDSHKGVRVFEAWHLPCARIPDGCMIVVLGDDVVVMNRSFPYHHRQLPLSVLKLFPRRSSAFGSTSFDDGVDIQLEINELAGQNAKRVRELGFTTIVGPEKILDGMAAGEDLRVPCEDPKQIESVRIIEPPGPSAITLDQLDRLRSDLHDLAGVAPVAVGQEVGDESKSGRSIAYQNKLDEMKLAPAKMAYTKFLRRFLVQALRLDQQYVTDERMVQVAGEHRRPQVLAFRGADLEGVDIHVEPGPGINRMHAATAAEAGGAAAAGIDPGRNMQLAGTGLRETADEAIAVEVIQAQIGAIISGAQVQPDDRVPAPVAIRELTQAIQTHADSPNVGDLIEMLHFYQQGAAPQQMPAPDGQMAAPPLPEERPSGPGDIPVQ